jgi:hypothetical protein
LGSLDAYIAIWLGGSLAVAGFFVASIASSMVRETLAWGMCYISAAMLRGVETGFARGFILSSSLAAPVIGFIIAYPEHVISLINPHYMWAAIVAVALAFSAYINVYEAYIANIASGLARGRAGEASTFLKEMRLRTLAVNAAYITLLTVMLQLSKVENAKDVALLWAILLLLASVARSLALLDMLNPEAKAEALKPLLPTITTLLLAATVELLFKPLEPAPKQRFFDELATVTPFALTTLTTSFIASIIVIPWNRKLYRSILQGLKKTNT